MERVFVLTYDKGCWMWVGKVNSHGYGVFFNDGKAIQASRLALRLFVRQDEFGECALHHCDNPGCVRPEHLYWGNKKENAADCINRGRFYFMPGRKGETSPNHRFTNADVIEMRRLHWQEHESYSEIGRMFRTNSGRVHNICNGVRWGHVKEGLPKPRQTTPTTTTHTELLRCIAMISILRTTLLRCAV